MPRLPPLLNTSYLIKLRAALATPSALIDIRFSHSFTTHTSARKTVKMSGKPNEPPPSYYADPQAPKPSYAGQQYPPQQDQFGGPAGGYPPQDGGYYQQQPNMGYYNPQQQGPYQQGPYYQQQGHYGPQGYYQDPRGNGSGNGLIEGLLAALCCCCCLDILI